MDDQRDTSQDLQVRLAADRTLLAWIRTGLAMMGFGFVVARFGLFLRELASLEHASPAHMRASLWIGTGLIALGVLANLLGAAQHYRLIRLLNRGQPYRHPRWSLTLVAALLLALIGAGMATYLFLVD